MVRIYECRASRARVYGLGLGPRSMSRPRAWGLGARV